ncbi:uncharacterized protein [Phyllobates terribilis]|uniref:uncharacterized protein n=1 Tax=Phyllobates terribilis TaxID=111132 RepID=UPI003CCB1D66
MAEKMKKTALLVIDMQNDFILAGGPMHVAGGAAIVPNVVKAVEIARQRGMLVIWVVREHDPLGRDVELFRRHHYSTEKTGPTAKGSVGSELVDGLIICEGDYKLVKTRFSAFFATHLHSLLCTAGIDSLAVTGVQTPNCIRQTVFDAVALDFSSVSVIVDATAAATPEIHAANIFDMKNIGVATPTLDEWINVVGIAFKERGRYIICSILSASNNLYAFKIEKTEWKNIQGCKWGKKPTVTTHHQPPVIEHHKPPVMPP